MIAEPLILYAWSITDEFENVKKLGMHSDGGKFCMGDVIPGLECIFRWHTEVQDFIDEHTEPGETPLQFHFVGYTLEKNLSITYTQF